MAVEQEDSGIYYLIGDAIPIQLFIVPKLSKEHNYWLNNLRNDLKAGSEIKKIIETSYGESSGNISELLENRPELIGTNREKLLSMVQDTKLAAYINEVYRPGASVGDGGTADKLIMEFYEGSSRHLPKAKERLVGINRIIDSGKLGLNDLGIAEALRDDLEYAIDLFK